LSLLVLLLLPLLLVLLLLVLLLLPPPPPPPACQLPRATHCPHKPPRQVALVLQARAHAQAPGGREAEHGALPESAVSSRSCAGSGRSARGHV